MCFQTLPLKVLSYNNVGRSTVKSCAQSFLAEKKGVGNLPTVCTCYKGNNLKTIFWNKLDTSLYKEHNFQQNVLDVVACSIFEVCGSTIFLKKNLLLLLAYIVSSSPGFKRPLSCVILEHFYYRKQHGNKINDHKHLHKILLT